MAPCYSSEGIGKWLIEDPLIIKTQHMRNPGGKRSSTIPGNHMGIWVGHAYSTANPWCGKRDYQSSVHGMDWTIQEYTKPPASSVKQVSTRDFAWISHAMPLKTFHWEGFDLSKFTQPTVLNVRGTNSWHSWPHDVNRPTSHINKPISCKTLLGIYCCESLASESYIYVEWGFKVVWYTALIWCVNFENAIF